MMGYFDLPVQLAKSMRADDAIFTARSNRLAPQVAIEAKLTPAEGARGERAAARAANMVFVPRDVIGDIHGTLVDHGIAIGYNDREVNADGTSIAFRHREWPLECVRWDASREVMYTRTKDASRVDIHHGDGRWTVYRKFAWQPWTKDACVLAGALIWAAHAEGLADWNGATRAHGLAKILGMLREGTAINNADGTLTPTAQTFLQLVVALANGDTPAGIAPPGSTVQFLANGSTAWQIFDTLTTNRERAAARVYQGTDATLGAQGGAPGVDISMLFGVATTRLQGDFAAIEMGLRTGVYEPWCAINDGDSRYAPWLRYQLPDPDESAKLAQRADNYRRFFDTLTAMRANKLTVDQDVVNRIAREFKVPRPSLASADTVTSTLVLAPTSYDVVVRGREARASAGLPPFGDARDDMTLDQLKNQNVANANIKEQQAAAPPEPPEPIIA